MIIGYIMRPTTLLICVLEVMHPMISYIGKHIVTNTQMLIPPVIISLQDKNKSIHSRLQFGKTAQVGLIIKKFTIEI